MPEYDFHHLSPYDMEVLARDLLQAHWQLTLENFRSGRDGGIDLRYSVGAGSLIVQVKHYAKTGVSGLLRDLEKEAVKVRKLKPKRYALVTTVHVSEAAHLLQMLNTTKCVHPAQRNHLRSAIEHALLAEAEAGCNNAELRDLIEAFSPVVPGSTVETSLQKAFVEYGKSCFRQDLEDCNSAELYEGLIDDLRNFSVVLKVDAGNLIAEVEFKKAEFEEEAEAYADAMQDEWKERWRAERYESGSVADMFDSLARDDRQ